MLHDCARNERPRLRPSRRDLRGRLLGATDLSSVDQAGTSAWRPAPQVAVVAAQVAVALAPLRAELAVGQRHAPAVAAVATTAVQRRREWTQVPLPDALDRQGKREILPGLRCAVSNPRLLLLRGRAQPARRLSGSVDPDMAAFSRRLGFVR